MLPQRKVVSAAVYQEMRLWLHTEPNVTKPQHNPEEGGRSLARKQPVVVVVVSERREMRT